MQKIKKSILTVIVSLLLCFGLIGEVQAEEQAEFHIQTAEIKADGTIRISIYLTNVSDLGGVEAELVYDPSKVTCVGSGLGQSFLGGFGETHCDEEKATVKCVAVYPEEKEACGELMYAVFQLNQIESYQPELRVLNLVDASTEIKAIPYTVAYQQVDGSWADIPDDSGIRAADGIALTAREQYGSDEDKTMNWKEVGETGEKSAEVILEEGSQAGKLVKSVEQSSDENVQKQKKQVAGKKVVVRTGIIITGIIFATGIIIICFVKGRRARRNE